jgi:hypothetical protein
MPKTTKHNISVIGSWFAFLAFATMEIHAFYLLEYRVKRRYPLFRSFFLNNNANAAVTTRIARIAKERYSKTVGEALDDVDGAPVGCVVEPEGVASGDVAVDDGEVGEPVAGGVDVEAVPVGVDVEVG